MTESLPLMGSIPRFPDHLVGCPIIIGFQRIIQHSGMSGKYVGAQLYRVIPGAIVLLAPMDQFSGAIVNRKDNPLTFR